MSQRLHSRISPPRPQSSFRHRLTFTSIMADLSNIDQSIECNGTIVHDVEQPPDFYTTSQVLCGFASCVTPNSSSLRNCCATPLQSHGLYRFCSPLQKDSDWEKLSNDWYGCLKQSPARGYPDGSYGIGCNRVPGAEGGASMVMTPALRGVWMAMSLVVLVLCWK
jgi:hypothetical protein